MPVSLSTASSDWPAAVHSRSPERAAQGADAPVAERRHAHPVEGAVAADASSTSGRRRRRSCSRCSAGRRATSSSSSSSVGIGSVPATRAVATSADGSSVIRSGRPHSARQVVVVEGDDHAVGGDLDVGLEVAVAERDGVRRTPRIVFSGASAAPPRWAKAIGAGQSRNGSASSGHARRVCVGAWLVCTSAPAGRRAPGHQ